MQVFENQAKIQFTMDEAFGEEGSYFTNIQRKIHKKEVENAHG